MEKQAYFQITERCNQLCVFCLRPADNTRDIDFKELKKNIDLMVEDGVTRVYITGGEPTLHKDLFKIIKYLKKVGIPRIDLQTNGVNLADKNLTSKLKKAGIDTVYFALHDHTEKLSGKTRGVSGYLKKTLAGIRNCIKEGFTTCIVHVIYRDNYKSLPVFIDFFKKLFPKINYLNLNLINFTGRILSNTELIPEYSKVKPFLEKAIRKCKEWGIMFNFSGNMPLCLIKGYEEYSMSSISLVSGLDKKSKQKVKKRPDVKNTVNQNKAPQCKKCTVNKICSGFYEEYAKTWGYDDFIPYKENIENILYKFMNYKNKKPILTKKK